MSPTYSECSSFDSLELGLRILRNCKYYDVHRVFLINSKVVASLESTLFMLVYNHCTFVMGAAFPRPLYTYSITITDNMFTSFLAAALCLVYGDALTMPITPSGQHGWYIRQWSISILRTFFFLFCSPGTELLFLIYFWMISLMPPPFYWILSHLLPFCSFAL